MSSTTKTTKITKRAVAVWTAQILLGLAFFLAGGMKLVLPAAAFTSQSHVPVLIIRLIGVFEFLGGIGVVLPGLTKIRRGLTPIAAAGLFTISAGATGASLAIGPAVMALVPAILGVLAGAVVAGRITWLPELGATQAAAGRSYERVVKARAA